MTKKGFNRHHIHNKGPLTPPSRVMTIVNQPDKYCRTVGLFKVPCPLGAPRPLWLGWVGWTLVFMVWPWCVKCYILWLCYNYSTGW